MPFRASEEVTSPLRNSFRIEPQKDFGVMCYLDSYPIKKGEAELPSVAMKPGNRQDRRPFMENSTHSAMKTIYLKFIFFLDNSSYQLPHPRVSELNPLDNFK